MYFNQGGIIMKKTKKLSAMLLASLISAGTVSSLSAGAMDFIAIVLKV